ncbi:hypothetical protein C7S13_6309 [Burkholderia cepacia]|nr:hypothetical protein [Burkholderia cepacia]QOH40004.1 hypothetical protein C7S14_0504 [Burkholderia cepacia]
MRNRCDGIGRVHADSIGGVHRRMFQAGVKCRGAGAACRRIAMSGDCQAADR